MYPYEIFPGFDFYALFYMLALISALVWLRILSDKLGMPARVYNLSLLSAVAAIAGGYLTSILAQSVYDWIETGTFRFGTGMTFYGGLLGGILIFVAVYFTVGRRMFGRGGDHVKAAPLLADIAACCVSFAHATGRIGCLFAGCCHGARTDAWYGIYHVNLGYRATPTQLFESVFLYLLFAVMLALLLRGKRGVCALYLVSYGVWRFVIEFFRADDRGASFIQGLTPSQTSAILFVAAGVAIYIMKIRSKKCGGKTEHDGEEKA